MTLVTVLSSLLALLILTAMVSWLVLYLRFHSSKEKQWATQVLARLRDAERCVRSDTRQLRALKKERDAKARSLREETFSAHLSEITVNALEAYPGIGPATIGKLRAAGFVNLATLQRGHIHFPGLGQKRLADISSAIRDLLSKAQSMFESGNSRRAQALNEQLEKIASQYDRIEEQARARARSAQEFIDQLEEEVEYARSVNFSRWFRSRSDEPLVPPDLMEAPLPNLETVLQAAEQPPLAIPVTQAAPIPTSEPQCPTQEERLKSLEIPPEMTVSADLVRRQWNLLSERFAPEKLSSLGPEFVNLAQTKLAAIRQAAELLLEEMGEPLEIRSPEPPDQDLRHNPDLDAAFGGM